MTTSSINIAQSEVAHATKGGRGTVADPFVVDDDDDDQTDAMSVEAVEAPQMAPSGEAAVGMSVVYLLLTRCVDQMC